MAGDQATNFTPRQVGILMLRIKSGAIKQALAAASPKTPAQTQQELQKMVSRNPRLQKWMKVSGASVQDLERMVRHGK
ncbi:hypothetical protein EKK58_01425 [Candidatus Dependentiae bacterium]|nr:MAG: hypothetical protein EKK58_01425 [Candidatus Dependentiae bacterium]